MAWTLALSALADAAAMGVYLSVSAHLWRRPASAEGRTALRALATYWATTGLFLGSSGLVAALAVLDALPFEIALAHRYTGLALASAGLAALLAYFAYLGTGSRRALPAFVAIYSAALAYSWHEVWASRPLDVLVHPWHVDLAYAEPMSTGALLVGLLLYLAPPIGGAIWFATLLRRTRDPTQRYRLMAVSAGLGAQMLGILLARLASADLAQFLMRPVLGIAVALLVLSAYRTPAWLSRRFAGSPSSAEL